MINASRLVVLALAFSLTTLLGGCGGSSESTLGAGEGGLSSASSVSAVSATD